MEEKKTNETPKQEKRELTYDELKNAATQISAQAQALFNENRELKVALQKSDYSNVFTALNFKFKVLDFAELFNSDFVKKCVESIEKTLTIMEVKEPEEEQKAPETEE